MGGYYHLEWPLTDVAHISYYRIYNFCQRILILSFGVVSFPDSDKQQLAQKHSNEGCLLLYTYSM